MTPTKDQKITRDKISTFIEKRKQFILSNNKSNFFHNILEEERKESESQVSNNKSVNEEINKNLCVIL